MKMSFVDNYGNASYPGAVESIPFGNQGGDQLELSDSVRQMNKEDFFAYYSKSPLCNNKSFQNIPLCSNNTDIQVTDFEYAAIVKIVVPIIFGFVVLVGVFGNTLVVIVIIINKQMRSTTNYLIFSLAMADLLFTVFCVPFTASDYMLNSWPFGSVWCKVVQYLTYVTAYASVYTLLLLSVDRYFAVVHPIYAMSIRTERNAVYAIVITWTVILSTCIPLYVVHGISNEMVCTFREDYNHAAFHIGFFVTMYLIPLVIIVALYVRILRRLWSQTPPGGTRSAESLRGKKRVTRMVVIVVFTFVICWMPIQIVLLLRSLNQYPINTVNIFVQVIGHVLAYMNSCINPILYAFLSDPFRKAFHKVIACGPERQMTNGRLTCEASKEMRPLNPRHSYRLSTARTSLIPKCEDGPNNASQQLIIRGDACQKYPLVSPVTISTTTTSFIHEPTPKQEFARTLQKSSFNGTMINALPQDRI